MRPMGGGRELEAMGGGGGMEAMGGGMGPMGEGEGGHRERREAMGGGMGPIGGGEGGHGDAHMGECSYNGSCSCFLAAALPAAGAGSSPPASADSEGREEAMECQPPEGRPWRETAWGRSVSGMESGSGVTLMVPIMHLKLLPESSLGCVLRVLLLVQFQDPVLDVGRIHPRGVVWLGWARARSQ